MSKKIISLLLAIVLIFGIAGCKENAVDITLTLDLNEITMIEGETYQLNPITNDAAGLVFSVSGAGIISLSNTGLITANNEGVVTVYITSKTDSTFEKELIVNVRKEISLISNVLEVNLTEEDTHQLVITSNDSFEYDVANNDIIVIDSSGLITAKEEGTTTITVTSTYDPDMSVDITVNVAKLITIDVNKADYVLVVGDKETIDTTSNDGMSYVSGDAGIVSVSETGELTALGFGMTTVRVTSTYDDSVSELVNVQVFKYTESIVITGSEVLVTGMDTTLEIAAAPAGAFEEVVWESSDTSILTVDAMGVVTAIAQGTASIIAKSVLDNEIADTFSLEVVNMAIVDTSKQAGDTFDYQGLTFNYGENLYSSVQAAIDASTENTLIYLNAGTFTENININKNNLSLIGIDTAIVTGEITVAANGINIDNLHLQGTSLIKNTGNIDDLLIQNLTVDIDTVNSLGVLISLVGASNVEISNNVIDVTNNNVMSIEDFVSGNFIIKDNVISTSGDAIIFDAISEYDITTEIKIMWNTITSADTAFVIDLMYGGMQKDIFAVARFNNVSGYTKGAEVNLTSVFDLTLNAWGKEPTLTDFVNVDEMYFSGYYMDVADLLTEAQYKPSLPVKVEITNPIDEIIIGESHTFEYTIYPYELSDAPVKFITGDPNLVAIDQTGILTPKSSGDIYIIVRSAQVSSIRTQVNFSIITTPGIEIMTTNVNNNVVVGDTFTLSYLLFPYTIETETATFTSSDPSIATIDASGNVTTLAEGLVTFTATLDSDSEITQDYMVYVYDALDLNNPLDYLTSQQVSYSAVHDWIAYGFSFNYNDRRAESVSRYYFDDIVINTSKIVPVWYAVRPGAAMDPLPAGVTQYNPENIHWVVVHDTASTATGSNALAHANYLWNAVANETLLWTSWHYTIDDHDVYQHLPENERGFHAGDGSTNPGEGSYTGGGNRNGVGIEMSVNDDGDMMRTWQRTAKLVVDILERNNLPISQFKYHNDFSGKDCPNTLRNAGLIPLFEEFVAAEFYMKENFPNASITFTSNNPEYLDNNGRVILIPDRAVTVSYEISVTNNGVTESRTFYTYIPGTVR